VVANPLVVIGYSQSLLVVSARNNETYASAVRSGVHEKSSGY
jgi:hypothetical protein